MSDGTEAPPPTPNPFSSMAVAKITRFGESDWTDLTIETDAIRQATTWLAGYLEAPQPDRGWERDGEVIAVIGDYGTGKTHLALHLVRRAQRVLDDPARVMYLDATAGSFVELHRRFMTKLGLTGVRSQVNDYYADIVADSLLDAGMGSEVVEWLRNRELIPQHVVERLGLMESALLRKVQGTLRRITDKRDFGTALTLLLRTGFDDAVWSWLTGGEPADVLVDRGITRPIDTEAAALEAMGVFALLYGGRQSRFVLVIDELDKLLSGSPRPDADIVPAFERLLEVFANAGACLVVCALPEARGVLRPSTRQRLSRTVEMVRLSVAEVTWFIRRAQQARLGRDELAPFTPESVRYLRDVAGGNARKVIRLCHDSFRIVDDLRRQTGRTDLTVTDEIVRTAENDQSGSLSTEDAHAAIRRVLAGQGWSFEHNHLLRRDNENSRVDFWVTFLDRRGGCAVLVTGSVLNAADAEALSARIAAVRNAAHDGQILLVVNGMLAEAARFTESLDAEPLSNVEYGFADNLAALIGAASSRLEQVVDPDPVTTLRQRMEQLTRQQSSIYDQLDHLADQADAARGGSDRRLAAIQRDLAQLTRAKRTEPGERPAVTLPADADRLLLAAVEALDELTGVEPMMTEAFGTAGSMEDVHRRFNSAQLFEAIGVASLLRAAVLTFRTAVAAWYATEVTGTAGDPRPDVTQRLDRLCQAYDDVVEVLPLFRLWPLTRSPWAAGHDSEAAQSMLRDRVEAAVGNLSPRVQRALVRAALPSGG